MGRVRIITDSTADIPKDLVQELDIVVVPLKINFGQDVYRDGVDIKSVEFISRLEQEAVPPTTSQPSPGEFVAVYEKAVSRGDTVISIHLSGELSGTVQSAYLAKTMTDSQNIHVVDSRSVSMGLGLLVIDAAREARNGKSVEEILASLKKKIKQTIIYFIVDSLDYLEKGGRIGKAAAMLGSILKIKPILALENGQIVPVERVRGNTRALERIAELAAQKIDKNTNYHCSLVFGRDSASTHQLELMISSVVSCEELIMAEVGPVIMAHAGPDLTGIVICPNV